MADYEILADGDSSDYEILADGDAPDYSSASDLPESIGKKTYGGLANALGGFTSLMEDYGKYLNPTTFARPDTPEEYKYGDDITSYAQDYLKDVNDKYQFEPGSAPYYTDLIGSTVGQGAPAILAGAMTGGAAALPIMLGQQMGSDYANAQNDGQSDETALTRSLLNLPVNYFANKVSLGPLFKDGSSLTRRTLESVGANLISSPFQTTANTIINQRTGETPIDYEQFLSRLGENAISDIGSGAINPAISHATMKIADSIESRAADERVNAMTNLLKSVDDMSSLQTEDPSVAQALVDNSKYQITPRVMQPPETQKATLDAIRAISEKSKQPIIEAASSSPRTPEFQAELQDAATQKTGFSIVNPDKSPINLNPATPSGEIVKPFTAKGYVRANLLPDEKQVIKELNLAEKARKKQEAQSLPVVAQQKPKLSGDVERIIHGDSFPKVLNYVQKDLSDSSTQAGFVNALKLQREAIQRGEPAPAIPDPKAEAVRQIEELKNSEPDYQPETVEPSAMLADIDPVRVNPHDIKVSKDIPNFKGGANERGVVPGNELKAKKYNHASGPIIVLKRLNGDMEVITGRHRLDLAQRLNEPFIRAQILDESQGVTPEIAMRLDAEINILDGQGTVRDYVTFFKGAGITEGEAQARGLLDRVKGSQGFTIATKSSPELAALYNADKISDSKAAAIAAVGKDRPGLQRLGIRQVLNKSMNTTELKLYMAGLADDPSITEASDEGDQPVLIPGGEASEIAWQKKVRAAASVFDEVHRLVKASDNAAKDPKAARQMGVDPKDPEAILKRVTELRQSREKWEKFWKYPELKPEIEKRMAELETTKKAVSRKRLKGQRGMAATDLLGIEQAARALGLKNSDTIKATHETLDEIETQRIIKQYGSNVPGKDNRFDPNSAEKMLDRFMAKTITSPEQVGKKSPEFKAGFLDVARRGLELRDSTAFDLAESAAPYFKLIDTTRVDDALAAARKLGESFVPTIEKLKAAGLSESEIEGFVAIRKTMNRALEIYRDTLVRSGVDPADAEMKTAKMMKANYVPFSRFGQYFVRGYTPDKNTAGFWMFENSKQMEAKVAELKAGGIDTDSGEFKPTPDSPYGDMHPAGFGDHLLQSFEVAGYSKNLKRSIAEYITSLAHYTSRTEMKNGFAAGFESLPKNSPSLTNYAKKYSDYLLSNSGEMATFRQFMTGMYLGLNLKSAMVNMTQSLTTTYPKAVEYLGFRGAAKAQAGAMTLLSQRLANPAAFAKANPELDAAIHTAIKQGTITENGFREMAGRSRSKIGETSSFDGIVNKTMVFFDLAEKANRYTAFVTGYRIAQAKGMSGDSALQFAKQFTTDTQFDYSRVNRPAFARGKVGAPLTTFRLFTYNYLRFLKNLPEGEHGGKALIAALGAMGSIGGLAAFPFMKELLKGAEVAGYDPKTSIKELVGSKELADTLIYGAPYGAGIADLSGSAGVGEIVPFPDSADGKGFNQAIGKTISGVPGDVVSRPFNAYQRYKEGNTTEAIQAILPESLKNVSVAVTAANRGAFTNGRGQRVLEDPTTSELVLKATGVTPKRLREQYDKIHGLQVLKERTTDNDNINYKIAKAKVTGGDWIKMRNDYIQKQLLKPNWERAMPSDTAIKKAEKMLRDPVAASIDALPNRAKGEARRRFSGQ